MLSNDIGALLRFFRAITAFNAPIPERSRLSFMALLECARQDAVNLEKLMAGKAVTISAEDVADGKVVVLPVMARRRPQNGGDAA